MASHYTRGYTVDYFLDYSFLLFPLYCRAYTVNPGILVPVLYWQFDIGLYIKLFYKKSEHYYSGFPEGG